MAVLAERKRRIKGAEAALPHAPSGDLEVLTRQLLAALPGSAEAEGLDGWPRYRDALVREITRAVAIGQLDVAAEQHARMAAFLPFIDDHLDGNGAEREAAVALRELIVILEIQAHALEVPRMEQKVRHPTALQHRVLAVLSEAEGPLDGTTVWELIPPADRTPSVPGRGRPQKAERPTRARVYQVLEDLRNVGLVVRSDFPNAEGRRTAHYRMWETGRDLCRRVGIGRADRPSPDVLMSLVSSIADKSAPLARRRLELQTLFNEIARFSAPLLFRISQSLDPDDPLLRRSGDGHVSPPADPATRELLRRLGHTTIGMAHHHQLLES